MNALRRLRTRSPVERRLLAHAVVLHAAVIVALRLVRFGRLRQWGSSVYAPHRPVQRSVDQACILWAVHTAAANMPIGRTCLSEALTAHWLMAAFGHHSEVRFGVAGRGAGQVLEAHAWLESPATEADPAGFAPLSPHGARP